MGMAKSWKSAAVKASSASFPSKMRANSCAATALHKEADQNMRDSSGLRRRSLCRPVKQ